MSTKRGVAHKGYDPARDKEKSGPQQEAAAQAEAERKNDSYLAGLEAGEKASDELHRPWENRHDPEKVAEKREQIEAAKKLAAATCGAGCKGYEQDFNEAFDSGFGGRERARAVEGMVKTAVYVGLAGAGAPKNSVGSGGVKPPPRTKTQSPPGKVELQPKGDRGSGGGGGAQAATSSGPIYKTTKEASQAAESLGFKRVNQKSHGQAVFSDGKRFITRDVDGHKGGAWKMADSVKNLGKKETRAGTFDAALKKIGE